MFSWLNFLTYAVITAVTPGPNNIMSMSNAGRLGFKKSIPFNLGIWGGFSIVMLLCTLFVSLLSSIIPKVELPMLLIGAAYMIYLAWKTFISTSEIAENNSKNGFLSGLVLQFINPKIYIYCIISMEAYI
ncbi:MAG: lysine transporter LysE, partial [Firmicutes bacterium]|nr:lysine transporter LysE [Bacillota bacterium]